MTDVQPLQSGDPPHLGGYRLVGRLGAGGQGAVYLVETPNRPGEQFALKLLHAQLIGDADARHRFLREVEVAKRVARFSTAQVIETGENGDQPYIVSEYVPGPSLQELVNTSGPLTSAALDRLAVNTATALAAIHRAGVLHRDFKPGNVLLGPHGPVVIDFGIARALDSTGGVTMSSQVVGTPAFMAPEQIAGAEIGPAADLFAWAITMVYAANGRAAFVQNSIPALFQRILTAEPDLGVLDGSLRQIVDACLAKDPGARPTADQVVAYLTGATAPELPQPASPRFEFAVPTTVPAAPAAPARRRTLAIAAAAAALLLVGGVAGAVVLTGSSGPKAAAAGSSTAPPTGAANTGQTSDPASSGPQLPGRSATPTAGTSSSPSASPSRGTPKPSPSAATGPALGGLDLAAYCRAQSPEWKSATYHGRVHPPWYCWDGVPAPNGKLSGPIPMNGACRWQYSQYPRAVFRNGTCYQW